MYDKLIADLKEDAEWAAANEWETPICLGDHIKQSIEAIETLSMKLMGDEAAIDGMKREIERMVVAGNQRWIPVTERLPKEMETVIVTTGKNVGFSFCVNDYGTLEFYSPWNITHWMPLPEPPMEDENNV